MTYVNKKEEEQCQEETEAVPWDAVLQAAGAWGPAGGMTVTVLAAGETG